MKHDEQTRQTKQTLSLALKRLMREKPLNRITIQELVEECGINRKTFYYHFENIYALLKWTLEQEAVSLFSRYDLVNEHSKVIDFALDYIESNLSVLQNVVRSIGDSEVRSIFFEYIYQPVHRLVSSIAEKRRIHASESYIVFLSRFLTEAIAGTFMDCIERDALADREKLSDYIISTLIASIPAALQASAEF